MELEGIARVTLERYGFDDPPVDAFDLAGEMKFGIEWMDGAAPAWRFKRTIHIPRAPRPTRIHSQICHEIAHALLDEYRVAQSERAARYLGAALLVPWRALDRGLRVGWNLRVLMARHLNASAELIARRVVDMRHARFSVFDAGKLRYRIGEAHESEREMVAEVAASGAAVRLDDLTGAWPINDGRWQRVIVLAAA